MKLGGPLDSKSAARLLSAAAILDFMFLGFVLATIEPVLRQELGLRHVGLALPIGLYVALVLIYWLICEGFLGGLSLGRYAMRLNMRDKQGKPISPVRRSTRAVKKIMSLGLTGMNPNAVSGYDRAAEVTWYSPMAPRPLAYWQLAVMDGPDRGKVIEFRKVAGLQKSHQIKIGRDPNWADLALSRSEKASGQHCVLRVEKKGVLYIRDMNSSNGTWTGGRRVGPEKWMPLAPDGRFRVGNITVAVLR
ncbi:MULTISPECIES: FHA domain-containing protein [unclassified Ruegeria]|uniref:FHA domain-containing protein n=1 Tax=unclassified Ruegeria TaxID=2625375 RepID=UPI001488BDA7|nr:MULTISPECIES: FHA domain-containing protein [unclassified Ruegeria]NOD64594.1 FHA domain-containing protein [Ruegeria sp. HKCCD6109]NOD93808.1 FHA domain-containing protein [Ruegeria sp. HKCCD4884]